MTDNTGRYYVRADENHVSMTQLLLPADVFAGTVTPKRIELKLPVSGFQLDGLLTEPECTSLVKLAEDTGLGSIAWEYDPKYRSGTRLVVRTPELAAELWRRIRPLLHVSDVANVRPFGYGVSFSDVWRPYGINECIRFTKYRNGDHFARHRDGAFVLDDEHRSVHTVMVYLNSPKEYEGGETRFYAYETDTKNEQEPELNVCAKNKGAVGSGLVFQHQVWHEGRPVESGEKYILRTDLMFRRVAASPFSPSLRYASEPKYHEAEALYQKSIELQMKGDPAGSTNAYLAAQEIHANLATLTPPYGPEHRLLPADVMVEVLDQLGLSDILRRVWCVSRGWNALAKHPALWKRKYQRVFRGWESADQKAFVSQLPQKTPLKDWYTLFRTRWVARKEFKVVFADLGSVYLRYGMLGHTEEPNIHPAIVQKVSGHYWSASQGLSQYMCGWEAFRRAWESTHTFVLRPEVNHTHVQVLLRWMLLSGFGTRLMPLEHPLLLARPAEFTDADCTHIGDVMRTLVGVPCVSFIDPAICTLAALDLSSGMVISIGRYALAITGVVDETVIAYEVAFPPPVVLWRTANKGWDTQNKDYGFLYDPKKAEKIQEWCNVAKERLGPMLQKVMKQVAGLPAQQRQQVLARVVLRGNFAPHIHAAVEAMVTEQTKGTVTKLDSVTSMEGKGRNGYLQSPPVTLDIYMGLEKLCSTVSRAQKYFASIEPALIRFNRTLLLVLQVQGVYHVSDAWVRLQGWHWKTREAYDEKRLTKKQIKVFPTVSAMRAWWAAFDPQLQVAMREGLVRMVYTSEGAESSHKVAEQTQISELRAWQASFHAKLPLLLWLPIYSRDPREKEYLIDMQHNVFTQHSWSLDLYDSFVGSVPPEHQSWKMKLLNTWGKQKEDSWMRDPDPLGP